MNRVRHFAALLVILVLAGNALAADAPLYTASGVVVKSNAEVLILKPRGPDGRFGTAVSLKIRGTSKVTVVTLQKREGHLVPVQREGEVKDLQAQQVVAVIYTNTGEELVLLSAVASPVGEK